MKKNKGKNILVVAAHPDDAEIGIGGSILKFAKNGNRVTVIDLTNGEPTPFGTPEKRINESEKAVKILRADKRITLGLENRYLFDSKENRMLLAEQIRILKPEIILCPYFEDAHPDHEAASKISEGARFYAKLTKTDMAGEPHYPFYLFYYFCCHLRKNLPFSFLIDISSEMKEKERALKCYKTQFFHNPKNKTVIDRVKVRNEYYGGLIRKKYAEPLYTKEAVNPEDFKGLFGC